MRTKYFSRGIASILLALAFATSMVFVSTPVSAASHISNNYSAKVISVTQGDTFVLRTRLAWDEVGVNGYYLVMIVWEDNNNPYDNFEVVKTAAWIDNDADNVYDGTDILLENTTVVASGAGTNGTRWAFQVKNTGVGDPNDGELCVEIYLKAASRGVPHRENDNHPINVAGWGGTIDYAESTPLSTTPLVTTIDVNAWNQGVVVRGKANTYAVDRLSAPQTPPPYVLYGVGSTPPIMAAQRVSSGAVIAGGIGSSTENGRWDAAAGDKDLDELLHSAFQWGKPGATKIAWHIYYGVYVPARRVYNRLVENLRLLGYAPYEENLSLIHI